MQSSPRFFFHCNSCSVPVETSGVVGIGFSAKHIQQRASTDLASVPLPGKFWELIPDFSSALRDILQRVCELAGWDLGEAWIPDSSDCELRCSPIWYCNAHAYAHANQFRRQSEGTKFAPGQGLPGRVWQSQEPEWLANVSHQSQTVFCQAETACRVGIGTALGVPVIASGRVLMVLVFYKAQVQPHDGRIMRLVVAIASQLGTILQLQSAQQELTLGEQRLNRLIDSLPGIVFATGNDPGWSPHYLSQGCYPLTGYHNYELTGPDQIITYNQITHPEDLPRLTQTINQAIAQHQPYVCEYRIQTRSGEERWMWEKGCGIFNLQGEPLGLEGFITDITDLKNAEVALRYSEARYRSQSRVLEMIATHCPLPDILAELVALLEARSGNVAGSILLLSPDGQHLRLGAAANLPDHYNQMVDGIRIGPNVGSCGTAVYRRAVVISKDIATDPLWHNFRDLTLEAGLRACWSIPIFSSQRKVLGTFALYHPQPASPTAEDWQFIETITHLAGIALEQHQAKETLAQREQYLASLVDVQRHLLLDDLAIPYDTILAALGQASGASRVYIFANHRDDMGQLRMSQIAEWCAEGITPEINNPDLQNSPYAPALSRWTEVLGQGEVISAVVADLPDAERKNLEPQQILSILMFPLLVNGTFWGFIGFDNCLEARPWESTEVDLLRAAAGAIALRLERLQTRDALEQAEQKYRGIFENAVEGIFQSSPAGRYLTVNPMLAQIYGYSSPTELIETLTDIEHQLYVDPRRRSQFIALMQQQGAVLNFESEVYRQDGSTIWIAESARCIYDSQGQLEGYEGTVEDISHRKQAEIDLRRRDNLLQGVATATNCLLTNPDLRIAIPKVLETLGHAAGTDRVYIYENHPHPETGEVSMSMRSEWVRATVSATITQAHWQNRPYATFGLHRWYTAFLQGQAIKGSVREFPLLEQSLLGQDQILSILMVPIFVDDQLWGYIGFDECYQERDWTGCEESILVAIAASIGAAIRRQRTEAKMRHQAFHDALTGLPNRSLFDQQLELALTEAKQTGDTLGVMFLDLDRFKTINDTLGHAVGDLLLQQVTRRLTACLRETDLIARWGGDEFTLILPCLKTADDAARIAQHISTALKPAFYLHDQELYITSSMGISLYPFNGSDGDTLLKNADAALYRAKEQGRNNYQFYTSAINPQASELLTLDHSLHRALEQNEFLVYYQPQFHVVTGEIIQMEALLRWQHPRLGIVSPATFITLAEENGLIIPIGEWVLRVACTQTRVWQAMGATDLRIAVNLSARQFQQPDLVKRIASILAETHLPPICLELEITETAVMQDVSSTCMVLQELQDMGVRIAMDDFGTGYSSLNYLKQFPLHALKIDRSFVRDLTEHPEDQAIVSTIITLGQGLNLSVVAEGVETQAQVDLLRSLNCTEMQGYWFSKPLGAQAATRLLQSQETRFEQFNQSHS
jgi:diguanylate cyclase (GGDEF)-like protein/PAS domain S-box-containing protein